MAFRTHCMLGAGLVILVLSFPALGQQIIVDNTDSGFTVLSGTWDTATSADMYGTNFRTHAANRKVATAAVEWRPNLSQAGDYEVAVWYPAGDRPNDVRYSVQYNGGTANHTLSQRSNAGQWNVLGTYSFAAGTAGAVSVSNLTSGPPSRIVAADAVRFVSMQPVELTMAVSPAGTGTTTPSGGPHTYSPGTVVNISVSAAPGYVFNQWQVSAGSGVANPSSASTTVTMDVSKTVTAVFVEAPPPEPAFRAFWVDVFHVGMQNESQVDQMIDMALAGNYNALVVEALAYHDNEFGSHGAYWQSDIVARSSYVTPSFDPLAYIIQQARANGLEVHAWLVAYRASSTWPPPGNSYLAARPEWLMVPRASTGSVAPVGSVYTFDPGSPDVQDYLVRIVREIATNYDLDGIHWDYIRYTQTDAGYSSDTSYSNSGLARFHRLTGRSDLPPATGDTQWNDFRRQTIDELISRCQAEVPLINNPRQPLRHTAAVVTWGDAPSNFTSTSAYIYFQNWEKWMRLGWLDASCPMVYYREHYTSEGHDVWYRNWIQACRTWSHDRHFYAGQANYLNYMDNSIIQMQYALNEGNAEGIINYSYATTRVDDPDYWAWYPYVADHLYTTPVPTPNMPWRDPATATDGTIFGRVLDWSTGLPVDGATVQVGSMDAVQSDGNGYYVITLVPATSPGTSYSISASKTGLGSTASTVDALPAQVVIKDLLLGTFTDCNANGIPDECDLSCDAPNCTMEGCGQSEDCNSNGVPDECDPDADNDGIPDECDNCPADHNPNQEDSDDDGVGDACDQCPDTIPGITVDQAGCPPHVPGDFDRDGDVDLNDFELFVPCAAGSTVPVDPACQSRDLDDDDDVDQEDFGIFQRCYSGSDTPADPGCAG